MREFGVIGPDGAAVGDEESGISFAGGVIERVVGGGRDWGAVFAFELYVSAWGELKLREEVLVDVGDLGVLAAHDREEFVGAFGSGDLGNDEAGSTRADREAIDGAQDAFSQRRGLMR